MPFRTWIIAIAFGLAVSASGGQAQYPSDEANGQATNQQTPSQTLPLPFPVELIEDQAEADARKRREDEAANREIKDLAAQEGMNAATQAMNEATQRMAEDSSQMVIATWFGVCLLFATLLLTLQANRAALTSVKISERIGNEQLRSYLDQVAIVGLPTSHDRANPDNTTAFSFRVHFTNHGQTPAASCIFNSEISKIGKTDNLPPSLPKRALVTGDFAGSRIGPGDDIQHMAGMLPIEEIEASVGADFRFILQCRVDYIDFNNTERFTKSCCQIAVGAPIKFLREKPFDPNYVFYYPNVGENNRGT